jgi:hypothetical protein
MRIGLDFSGVITRFPVELSILTNYWIKDCGHEVHIVSNSGWDYVKSETEKIGVLYTHNCPDVGGSQKTEAIPMLNDFADREGSSWMHYRDLYLKEKGEYAKSAGLNIHFDDSIAYAKWFPESCLFVHVRHDFTLFHQLVDQIPKEKL